MKLAAFRQQTWAITGAALNALEARSESMADLVARGLSIGAPAAEASPADTARIAFNGGNPIVPEIVNGVATIEIMGDLVARAPWWAKAYLGAIDPYDLADAVDALAADATVTALVLEIDCCGGTVSGTEEARAALDRFQAAGKTVTANAAGVLASAAYWMVAGADAITATATTAVGSLGVFQVLVDQSAALSAIGVKLEVVGTGPLKGAGADGTVTPAVRDMAQRIVDALSGVFRDAVAAGRGFTAEQVAAVFTGDVWIGKSALAAGLIDSVMSVADEVDKPSGDAPPPAPLPPALDSAGTQTPGASALVPITPAAAAATEQESPMDTNTQAALSALSASHPTLAAALVGEAIKPGATADGLRAFAAGESAKAVAADLAAVKGQLAEAQAAAGAATARAAKAESDLAALKGHIPAHADPGPGDAAKAKDASKELTSAEFMALDPHARGEFRAAGGKIVDAPAK